MIILNATPHLIDQLEGCAWRLEHDNLQLYGCTVGQICIYAAYGGSNQCAYQLSTMLIGLSCLYKFQLKANARKFLSTTRADAGILQQLKAKLSAEKQACSFP